MNQAKSIKKKPLVSIAIPVYNGGEYFDKCLEGILNQTYQNWECIINNNCSADDTLQTANKYAKKDPRFKVFTNENFISMTPNWNKACSRISADTKYLKVVGADDWLFPESIEKMVEVMEKHPSVGICSAYRLKDKEVEMDGLDIWDGNVYNGKDILYKQLTRTLDITGSNTTVMFSIEHLKKNPRFPVVFDETTYHEDTELEYELMNISDVGFVFQVLTYTRRHAKAHTITEVYRYNTTLQFNEKVLWQYKGNDRKLNKLYRAARLDYAYYLFYKTLTFDRAAVQWHKKYIVRKFTLFEFIAGIITRNKISKLLIRTFRKLFRLNNK
ncbi:MAG: glycosyltransferase family 2 protein [Bacteroidales bacterium]|nr:glycosyltransferase family 2 protein [Bacteroidales bacterium]